MSTIGNKIDTLYNLREQKRAFETQANLLSKQINELEEQLVKQMDEEEVMKSTGTKATVYVTTSIKPSVTDWDAFYAYIHRHKY